MKMKVKSFRKFRYFRSFRKQKEDSENELRDKDSEKALKSENGRKKNI